MKLKNTLIYCGCSALIGLIVMIFSRKADWFGEWYANHIFPIFPDTIGRVISIFPFSVFEILIYLLAILLTIYTIYLLILVIIPGWRSNAKKTELKGMCASVTIGCTLFLMLSLACTVNYSRDTFADITGIQLTLSSQEELLELCELLMKDVVELSGQIPVDENGLFTISNIDVEKEAKNAMKNLGEKTPVLSGYYPNPKPVFSSEFMSRLNLTGIYSPFTLEANYNNDIPDYLIPYTICHELAHLKGFMREDEAGFIAYLACRDSKSIEFRYSGAINALSYALNAYYNEVTPEEYSELRHIVPEQVTYDLAANYEYWEKFKGKASEITHKANDNYLKVNAQEGGVKSYGKMVDLLLAEYRIGAAIL